VGPHGVTLTAASHAKHRIPKLGYGHLPWDPMKIAALLWERNQPALRAAGWSAETGEEHVVLRRVEGGVRA
jgi:hypothetical protein